MLLLCSADFHGREDKYEAFIETYKKYEIDLVIIAGDFGYVEANVFNDIDVPILAVYGNMDGDLSHLRGKIDFIDGMLREYKGYKFLGIGEKYPEKIDDIDFDIIVSHIPPYKTKDRAFFGMHIGSKWLRNLMEEKKPKYIICGHVHEDAGYEKFGDTYVVNCSVGKKGIATVIDIEKNEVRMIGYL